MNEHCYENCVIAVTIERNTCVVQVPKSLEPVFRRTTDQLDNWFEECFADRGTEGLQPGIYLCTIRTEPDPDVREEFRGPEHVTIFVEDIVPAVLTRGGE